MCVKILDFIVKLDLKFKILNFFKWLIIDICRAVKNGRQFGEYGLSVFCGRQGAGKTMGMVWYLEQIKKRYPSCIIVTNFGYKGQDFAMNSWRDFFEIRNGTKGVVFAIDELQNEYNSNDWKTFPENLLKEVTQQRKQRIKIIATSQVFTRVVKQLREQCFEVVNCFTIAGRWTFLRSFDAEEYNAVIDNPEKKLRLHRKWRRSFVQTDELREKYDSYAIIDRMRTLEYIPRERVS